MKTPHRWILTFYIPIDVSHVSIPTLSKFPSKPSNSKKEATLPGCQKKVSEHLDSPIKVVVRIRSVNDHERDVDWMVIKFCHIHYASGIERFLLIGSGFKIKSGLNLSIMWSIPLCYWEFGCSRLIVPMVDFIHD